MTSNNTSNTVEGAPPLRHIRPESNTDALKGFVVVHENRHEDHSLVCLVLAQAFLGDQSKEAIRSAITSVIISVKTPNRSPRLFDIKMLRSQPNNAEGRRTH